MNTNDSITKISPSAAESRRAQSLYLDVRTPAEFEEAHIEGSVPHPLSELDAARVKELAQGREHCVLICRSGNRARQAADKLKAAGLDNLAVMEGGVQAWDAAGLPLKRGAKTMSLERQVRIAAGSLVLLGAALGTFVNPLWYGLSAFVGAGLIFAGVTDTCAMGLLIARMPWNTRRSAAQA